ELSTFEEYQDDLAYKSFLFATAVLVDAETKQEVFFIKDTKSPVLFGGTFSSIHVLVDPENELLLGQFFVFPDISVRMEGNYKLKVVLFKIEGGGLNPLSTQRKVVRLAETLTDAFRVLPSNKFPKKKLPPTVFSRSFAQQGVRMKLKRQPRSNWIIENADNGPISKRRVTELQAEEQVVEKKMRTPRITKAKVDQSHCKDSDSIGTQKSELKVTKNRIADLLNSQQDLESFDRYKNSSGGVIHPAVKIVQPNIQDVYHPKIVTKTSPTRYKNKTFEYGENSIYHQITPAYHYRDQPPPFYSYQDYYEQSMYQGPRLPPIRSLSSNPYPPYVGDQHYQDKYKDRSYNSPYWRYWRNLEKIHDTTNHPRPWPDNTK
ncbi:hypothetical protein HDV06_000871, partial [Boothiomyces sp. JEL0866]